MQPLDRIVFETDLVRAGSFRCPANDRRFRDSGPTDNALVVFPRTAVRLRYAGSREFVADPTISTIYNRGQEYTRGELSAEGDRCEWFGVAPAVALEIAGALDPRAFDNPDRPFAREWTAVDSALYLAQRTLFSRLARGVFDPLEAEQAIIEIVAAVLKRAYDAAPCTAIRPRADDAHRELVQRARSILLATVNDHLTLSMIASRLGVSEFHLCRVFREQTGMTLHEYRTELKLRKALEMLPEANNLSRLAFDLGFSSHSHFTDTVRRRFGRTPGELRRSLACCQ